MRKLFVLVILLAAAAAAYSQGVPCTQQYPDVVNSRSTLCDAGDSATTTLTGTINSVATVLNVGTTSKFPATGVIVVESEQMIYTALTSTTITVSTRGANGTTATSHAIGITVKGALTAQHIHAQSDAQVAVETKLGTTPSMETNASLSGYLLAGRGTGTSSWRSFAQLGIPSISGVTDTYFPYNNAGTLGDSPLLRYGSGTAGFPAGTPTPLGTSQTSARLLFYPGASGAYYGLGLYNSQLWFNVPTTASYLFGWGGDVNNLGFFNIGRTNTSIFTEGSTYTFSYNNLTGDTSSSALIFSTSGADTIRMSPNGNASTDFLTGMIRPFLNNNVDLGTSTKTFKDLYVRRGRYVGSTSGQVDVVAPATAGSNTMTLPAATDTFVGKATTDTLTNKTLDVEGTGNSVTASFKTFLAAAGCNNATPGSFWDLPATTPAVSACVTGTNIQKGVLDFADSGPFIAQNTMLLPADFSGGIDARIIWTTSATSGNVKWNLATICTDVAASATDDPAFNTASTVTTAVPGTTLRVQTSSIASVTITGCTAGSLLHFKISRDGTDGSDTAGATVRLIGVEITTRRAM